MCYLFSCKKVVTWGMQRVKSINTCKLLTLFMEGPYWGTRSAFRSFFTPDPIIKAKATAPTPRRAFCSSLAATTADRSAQNPSSFGLP